MTVDLPELIKLFRSDLLYYIYYEDRTQGTLKTKK